MNIFRKIIICFAILQIAGTFKVHAAGNESVFDAGPFLLTDTYSVNDTVIITDNIDLENNAAINNHYELIDTITINDTIQLNDTIDAPAPLEDKAETEEAAEREEVVTEEAEAKKKAIAEEEEDQDTVEKVENEEEEPEPSNWERGMNSSLSFSQISLSNWTAGGQNSISFTSYLNAFVNYETPDEQLTWENTLDLAYGLINQEHRRTVKSDDKIDFSTKMGLKASDTWSYSSLISFRTQMTTGYKSPGDTLKISNFMAPAYLNVSIGMNHNFDENITFYLSPVAGRVTYVLDEDLSESGSFGVEPGKNKRYEFGGFIRVQFRAMLMENISVNSRLEIFSNYLEKPQNMDVNSDTRINMQITRFISANLTIQMLYDDSVRIRVDEDTTIGPRLQLKQVFGLGFSYRL